MDDYYDDDYMTKKENFVEFKCVQFNDKGQRVATISRIVRGEDTEYLPNILNEFACFLQGMTFSYVIGISALDKDGEEVSCSEF
jgi:hypothetical protein